MDRSAEEQVAPAAGTPFYKNKKILIGGAVGFVLCVVVTILVVATRNSGAVADVKKNEDLDLTATLKDATKVEELFDLLDVFVNEGEEGSKKKPKKDAPVFKVGKTPMTDQQVNVVKTAIKEGDLDKEIFTKIMLREVEEEDEEMLIKLDEKEVLEVFGVKLEDFFGCSGEVSDEEGSDKNGSQEEGDLEDDEKSKDQENAKADPNKPKKAKSDGQEFKDKLEALTSLIEKGEHETAAKTYEEMKTAFPKKSTTLTKDLGRFYISVLSKYADDPAVLATKLPFIEECFNLECLKERGEMLDKFLEELKIDKDKLVTALLKEDVGLVKSYYKCLVKPWFQPPKKTIELFHNHLAITEANFEIAYKDVIAGIDKIDPKTAKKDSWKDLEKALTRLYYFADDNLKLTDPVMIAVRKGVYGGTVGEGENMTFEAQGAMNGVCNSLFNEALKAYSGDETKIRFYFDLIKLFDHPDYDKIDRVDILDIFDKTVYGAPVPEDQMEPLKAAMIDFKTDRATTKQYIDHAKIAPLYNGLKKKYPKRPELGANIGEFYVLFLTKYIENFEAETELYTAYAEDFINSSAFPAERKAIYDEWSKKTSIKKPKLIIALITNEVPVLKAYTEHLKTNAPKPTVVVPQFEEALTKTISGFNSAGTEFLNTLNKCLDKKADKDALIPAGERLLHAFDPSLAAPNSAVKFLYDIVKPIVSKKGNVKEVIKALIDECIEIQLSEYAGDEEGLQALIDIANDCCKDLVKPPVSKPSDLAKFATSLLAFNALSDLDKAKRFKLNVDKNLLTGKFTKANNFYILTRNLPPGLIPEVDNSEGCGDYFMKLLHKMVASQPLSQEMYERIKSCLSSDVLEDLSDFYAAVQQRTIIDGCNPPLEFFNGLIASDAVQRKQYEEYLLNYGAKAVTKKNAVFDKYFARSPENLAVAVKDFKDKFDAASILLEDTAAPDATALKDAMVQVKIYLKIAFYYVLPTSKVDDPILKDYFSLVQKVKTRKLSELPNETEFVFLEYYDENILAAVEANNKPEIEICLRAVKRSSNKLFSILYGEIRSVDDALNSVPMKNPVLRREFLQLVLTMRNEKFAEGEVLFQKLKKHKDAASAVLEVDNTDSAEKFYFLFLSELIDFGDDVSNHVFNFLESATDDNVMIYFDRVYSWHRNALYNNEACRVILEAEKEHVDLYIHCFDNHTDPTKLPADQRYAPFDKLLEKNAAHFAEALAMLKKADEAFKKTNNQKTHEELIRSLRVAMTYVPEAGDITNLDAKFKAAFDQLQKLKNLVTTDPLVEHFIAEGGLK